jgi:hypothetical protein
MCSRHIGIGPAVTKEAAAMTRVLVVNHDLDVGDIQADELRRAGFDVDQCEGPVGGDACPVLNGTQCWQVELADVLVYDEWTLPDGRRDLIDDLRALHPDKPMALGRRGATPAGETRAGSTLVADVQAALERARAQAGEVTRGPVRRPDLAHIPRW